MLTTTASRANHDRAAGSRRSDSRRRCRSSTRCSTRIQGQSEVLFVPLHTHTHQDQIPVMSKALSALIQDDLEKLEKVVLAGNADRATHSLDPQETIRQLKATINHSARSVVELDVQSTAIAQRIHKTSQQVVEHMIRTLEQTLHGSVSRGAKAKADYLAIVTEGMSRKLDLQYTQLLNQMDSASFRNILAARNQDMSKQNRSLVRQLRERHDLLDDLRSRSSA